MRGTSKAVEKWRCASTSASAVCTYRVSTPYSTDVLERRSLEKGPKLFMHNNLVI